jgi:predicted 3-demethylubiquinone-9 3-methyltransferase (glyoxalase superfamily)
VFRHRLPEPASRPATHSSNRNCAHAQWSLRHWFPEFRTRFHRKTRRSVGAWPRRSLRRFHLRSSPKNPTREIRLQSRQTSAKRRFITRCISLVKPIQGLRIRPFPDRVKRRLFGLFGQRKSVVSGERLALHIRRILETSNSALGAQIAARIGLIYFDSKAIPHFCGLNPQERNFHAKITPFLWFDAQAEEATLFYTSIFKNSKVGRVTRYGDAGPGPKGAVMSATFELEGQHFMALNRGPHFKFSPAVSLFVDCKTQAEVDELWEKLSAGRKPERCGWLTDKFGLSWQIIPTV